MDIATATTEDLERLWDDANRQENLRPDGPHLRRTFDPLQGGERPHLL